MIRAGIIGVTGYTGIELLRLLQQHPTVTVTHGVTESYVGQEIAEVYPHLQNHMILQGEKLDIQTLIKDCDVIFIALPHGHAINIVPPLLAAGKKIIDLGTDFRLKNPADYEKWYQHTPAPTAMLAQAVYGLPESTSHDKITNASLIANPGCYPTATILATLPALKAGIIDIHDCIFDAKSGVSGAGRSLSLRTHYCEINENIIPYQIAGLHRHTPEIEQALSDIAQQDMTIQFTPHLVPMLRGLLVTAYFKLTQSLSTEEVQKIYQNTYQHNQFIRIHSNTLPQVNYVRGTNYCDIGIQVDTRTQRLIVVSVIDNLIKGAAGQAIQNMNIMYQLPETTGLIEQITTYP